MTPTHVVVDTRDGYVFSKDSAGDLFTEDTAVQFARGRNEESIHLLRPMTYEVFRLEPGW